MKKIFSLMFLVIVLFVPVSSAYADSACVAASTDWFSIAIGIGGSNCTSSNYGQFNIDGYNSFGLPNGRMSDIIATIMRWFLGMIGIFGILGFLISGSMYLLAAGDDELIKRAKKTMTNSIIGILVGLSGLIAVNVIFHILNASSTEMI